MIGRTRDARASIVSDSNEVPDAPVESESISLSRN